MKEIWKDIKDYEGLYQISNLGNIRRIVFINNRSRKNKIKELKIYTTTDYSTTILCKDGKIKNLYIHKLVADAFLNKKEFKSMPSEDRNSIDINKLEINHKDENKTNNKVTNLEWCTHKYNMNYGTRDDNRKITIVQYDKNMNYIKKYKGIGVASRENKIDKGSIIQNCKGKLKSAGGYIWKYEMKERLNK